MYREKVLESQGRSTKSTSATSSDASKTKRTPRKSTPAKHLAEVVNIGQQKELQKEIQKGIQLNQRLQKQDEEKNKKLLAMQAELKQKTTENAALVKENEKIKKNEENLTAKVARLTESEKLLKTKLAEREKLLNSTLSAAAASNKEDLSSQTKKKSFSRHNGKCTMIFLI